MWSRRAVVVAFVLASSLRACAPANDSKPPIAAVVPGSDHLIDPTGWTITAPVSGATNAVRVAFPEPMEQALLDALGVLAPDGSPLPGDGFAAQDRRGWQFTPTAAWPAGQYQLAAFGKPLMPFSVR